MEPVLASDELETHDIYFAAYLLVSGCEMIRQRRQGQRVYFIFKNVGGSIQDMQRLYYTNQASVKAYQYSQQVAAVKKLCF